MLIAVVAHLASPSAALAFPPMQVTSASPADAASFASVASTDFPFQVPFDLHVAGPLASPYVGNPVMSASIASQNTVGLDGTLSGSEVDFLILRQSTTDPTDYQAFSNALFWKSPGIYYWQVKVGFIDQDAQGVAAFVWQMSSIYTLTVTAPSTPPAPVSTPPAAIAMPYRMTLSDVAVDIPATIKRHDRSFGHLTRACSRTARVSFRCLVSWRDAVFVFAGTLWISDDGEYIRSSFRGIRARFSCAKSHGVSACARPFRW